MAGTNPEQCVSTLGNGINALSFKNGRSKSPDFAYHGNPEGRVLVLYTGGTIGMVRNADDGEY